MDEGAFDFWIHPERRAGVAVYAVAIGDYLGMDLDSLKRLRAAVEASALTGEEGLDVVLRFVEGLYRHNTLGFVYGPLPVMSASTAPPAKVLQAYGQVSTLIQPVDWKAPDSGD
ncbi:MAG: hypothetical protein ACYC96_12895 [Fimbriimonadaceae bacterium]